MYHSRICIFCKLYVPKSLISRNDTIISTVRFFIWRQAKTFNKKMKSEKSVQQIGTASEK